MRGFLRKTLLFVLLLGAIATVLDIGLTALSRGKQFREYADFNIINTGRARPRIVVIGDSRARYGLDPRVLEKVLGKRCYNLAMLGYPVTEQLAKLRYAIRHNGEPELVVACMDETSWRRLRLDTIFQYEQFLDDIRDPLVLDMVKDKVGFRPVDVLPWARFAGFPGYVASIAVGDTQPDAYSGFIAATRALTRPVPPDLDPPYEHDSAQFQAYLRAIREDRERYWPGARVVYVEPPYLELDSQVVMPHLLGQLDTAFERAVTFDLSLASDPSLFQDRMHLNEKGAARLSAMLADSLAAHGYGTP